VTACLLLLLASPGSEFAGALRSQPDAVVAEKLEAAVEASPRDPRVAKLVVAVLQSDRGEPLQWKAALAVGRLQVPPFRWIDPDRDYSHRTWEALCSSLLRHEKGADYLFEHCIDPNTDVRRTKRARAALLALASAPRPDARRRHEYVRILLSQFQSFPFHVEEDYDWVADVRGQKRGFRQKMRRHWEYWADLRPIVQRLLRRFTADPVTGELARDVDSGFQVANLERMKVWNGRHKERPHSPWIDPEGEGPPRTALREIREPGREFRLRWVAPWTAYWPLRAPLMPTQKDPLAPRRKELRETVLGPVMREGMKDPDWRVRGMAAIGLGRVGGGGDELWRALDREQDERVREAIAYALLLMREPSFLERWRARADLGGENPQVRALSILALGTLGDIGFLRKREDASPELAGCTLAGIGMAGDAADSKALTDIVVARSCPPGVRGAAAAALVFVGAADDMPRLVHAIRAEGDPVRRAAAAHALAGVVGPDDHTAIRAMAQSLLEPKGRFGGHRVELAFALAGIGGKHASAQVRRALQECLGDTTRAAELGSYLLALAGCDEEPLPNLFSKMRHEWDAAAAALGMAAAGLRKEAPAIRERLADAKRVYIPSALEAAGRLGDRGSLDAVRKLLREGTRDRVVAAGAVALARLRGAEAGPELLELWPRAEERAEFAGLAGAFGIAGPKGSEKGLFSISKTGRPVERAFALNALAAMASPGDAVGRRMREAFFVYDAPRTVTRLAQFGDSFFLAASDE